MINLGKIKFIPNKHFVKTFTNLSTAKLMSGSFRTYFFNIILPLTLAAIILLESREVISLLTSEIGFSHYQSFENFLTQTIGSDEKKIIYFIPIIIVKTFSLPFYFTEPILLITYRIIAVISCYFFVQRYLKIIFGEGKKPYIYPAFSFVGALIYTHYPQLMVGDLFSYLVALRSIAPLFLLLILELLERKKIIFFTLAISLLAIISLVDPRALLFLTVPAFVFLILPKILSVGLLKKMLFLLIFLALIIIPVMLSAPSVLPRFGSNDEIASSVRVPLVTEAFRYQYADPLSTLTGLSFEGTHTSYLGIISDFSQQYVVYNIVGLSILPVIFFLIIPYLIKLKDQKSAYYFGTILAFVFLLLVIFVDFGTGSFIIKLLFSDQLADQHDSTSAFAKFLTSFRTPRFLDMQLVFAYTTVIPAFLVITYQIFSHKKRIVKFIIVGIIMFSVIVLSFVFLTKGNLYSIDDYDRVKGYESIREKFEKDVGLGRFVLVPLSDIPKNFPLKPLSIGVSIFHYFFAYTLDTTVHSSLLSKGEYTDLANALQWSGLKYIIFDEYAKPQTKIKKLLDDNSFFSNIYSVGKLNVYMLNQTSNVPVPDNFVFVLGGYESFRIVDKEFANSDNKVAPVFLDGPLNSDIISFNFPLVSSAYKTKLDLTLAMLMLNNETKIIQPYKYTRIYDPQRFWTPGDVSDSHHSIWTWNIDKFAPNHQWEYSYDPTFGFVYTVGQDSLTTTFDVPDDERYDVFVRTLIRQNSDSLINIIVDNSTHAISTSWPYNSAEFNWVKVGTFNFAQGKHAISIKNIQGFNAVNVIMICPSDIVKNTELKSDEFIKKNTYMMAAIGTKKDPNILFFNILKNDSYNFILKSESIYDKIKLKIRIADQNFIETPDKNGIVNLSNVFLAEGITNLRVDYEGILNSTNYPRIEEFVNEQRLVGWSEPSKGVKETFIAKVDNDAIDGNYSYLLETDSQTNKTWSWVTSKNIPVAPGEIYKIESDLKQINAKSSHVAVNYITTDGKTKRLGFVPNAQDGSYNWKHFEKEFKVPNDATAINLILNAGWVNDTTKGKASTWFDGIKIDRLESSSKTRDIPLITSLLISNNDEVLKRFFTNDGSGNTKIINSTIVSLDKRYNEYFISINGTKQNAMILPEIYTGSEGMLENSQQAEYKTFPVYNLFTGILLNTTGNDAHAKEIEIFNNNREKLELISWSLRIILTINIIGIILTIIQLNYSITINRLKFTIHRKTKKSKYEKDY